MNSDSFFIHSFRSYLLCTYSVPSIVWEAEYTAANEAGRAPGSMELLGLQGRPITP